VATAAFTFQIYLNSAFRDVTADTKSVSIKYGRERVLDSFRSGQCVLTLNNQDNKYGPLTGGTYGSAQWINAEIRIAANIDSASYPTTLFRGTVEDLDVLYPDSKDSVVIVKAFDAMSKLAKTELVDTTFSEQVGSARFSAVLDNAQVSYPAQPGSPSSANPKTRDIDTSSITMAGATVAQLSTSTYLERLAFSEDGAIFVYHGQPGGAAVTDGDRGNILAYRKRDAPGSATSINFGAGAGEFGPDFTKIETSFGNELLYTRGVYQRSGGDIQTYDETVGQLAYGIRTIVRNNLLNLNDDDVFNAAKNFVALHSTPALRVSSITCKPLALTDAQAERVAKLTIYDKLTAQWQPAGAGSLLQPDLRVESISHDITPKDWTMRVGTSGSGNTVFLILDDPIFGKLDQNKLAP
jgi:hypothetical protein